MVEVVKTSIPTISISSADADPPTGDWNENRLENQFAQVLPKFVMNRGARGGLRTIEIRGTHPPEYGLCWCWTSHAVLRKLWIRLLPWENLCDSILFIREDHIRAGEKQGLRKCYGALRKCSGALPTALNHCKATAMRSYFLNAPGVSGRWFIAWLGAF